MTGHYSTPIKEMITTKPIYDPIEGPGTLYTIEWNYFLVPFKKTRRAGKKHKKKQ